MSIKKKLSEMSFCQRHAMAQEDSERLRTAIKMVRMILSKKDWEGLTSEKIAKATARVQLLYPTVNWKVAVNEGINQYLKSDG
jgi:hypothetical protein